MAFNHLFLYLIQPSTRILAFSSRNSMMILRAESKPSRAHSSLLQFMIKCQWELLRDSLKQVPGVEADDVIGTLAVKSVDAGLLFSIFKECLEVTLVENNKLARVVSPDKDFFQILSPSLRLLQIASRGFEIISFGMEDYTKKLGTLKPSQFVDAVSLVDDKSDNIPGIHGIGYVHAVCS